jgi:4a-hydroxytetrahydrobiopterin dehydratase
MGTLTNEGCTAWRRDSPRVAEAEIQELKPQIPEWALVDRDSI